MIKIITMLALMFSLPALATGVDTDYYDSRQGKQVLLLTGVNSAYERKVPNIKEMATCFDLALIDMTNNSQIGIATDCLSEIEEDENGNINIIGTTFFHLPEGKLITQGPLAIRPVDIKMVTADGLNVSHITGASQEGNTIVKGKGKYKHATANVRLSGMVDMSRFKGIGTPVGFSCIFILSEIKL